MKMFAAKDQKNVILKTQILQEKRCSYIGCSYVNFRNLKLGRIVSIFPQIWYIYIYIYAKLLGRLLNIILCGFKQDKCIEFYDGFHQFSIIMALSIENQRCQFLVLCTEAVFVSNIMFKRNQSTRENNFSIRITNGIICYHKTAFSDKISG